MTSNLSYFVIDTESTGMNIQKHEIVEISIIRVTDRKHFTRTIKAEKPQNADPNALKIIGKNFYDLIQGEDRKIIVSQINQFLDLDGTNAKHRVIIAHNSSFDRRFIWSMFDKEQQIFNADNWLCSMSLVRQYAKKYGIVKPKVNLKDSIAMVGSKKVEGSHNSLDDAKNTYFLWLKLLEEKIDYLPKIQNLPHSNSQAVEDIEPPNFDF